MRRRCSIFSPVSAESWVVVVLLVAEGLLVWGHGFTNSNVHSQLACQEIVFPPKAAFAHAKPETEITPAMSGIRLKTATVARERVGCS